MPFHRHHVHEFCICHFSLTSYHLILPRTAGPVDIKPLHFYHNCNIRIRIIATCNICCTFCSSYMDCGYFVKKIINICDVISRHALSHILNILAFTCFAMYAVWWGHTRSGLFLYATPLLGEVPKWCILNFSFPSFDSSWALSLLAFWVDSAISS